MPPSPVLLARRTVRADWCGRTLLWQVPTLVHQMAEQMNLMQVMMYKMQATLDATRDFEEESMKKPSGDSLRA